MQNDKKPFTPEFVDEQVEQLARPGEIHRAFADHQARTPETQLVRDLSSLYHECAGTRDRVWQRLELRMQHQALTRWPIMGKPTLYDRKPQMIHRDLSPRNALGYYLTLIAAVLIIAVLVGSMALILSTVRNLGGSSVGGHGPTSTTLAPTKPATSTKPPASDSNCPYADPSNAGSWRDAREQAICLKHQETTLHISRTVANHQVDFVAAYADSSRLVLLYIEHLSPTADAVSFTGLTLQGGIKLSGGASQSYGDLQGQRIYVQVTFDTTTVPAGTTTLHVQSIDDMLGETIQLGFTTPFHSTHH
jgi:hypothetical protein